MESYTPSCKDRSGLYWIGTNGGGINILDPNKRDFRFIYNNGEYPLVEDVIRAILIDPKGDFWIGTYNNGLWRVPGENSDSSFRNWMPYDGPAGSLPHRNISTLMLDSRNDLWVGSLGGLDRFNRETERFDHFFPERDGVR